MNLRTAFNCLVALSTVTKNPINDIDLTEARGWRRNHLTIGNISTQKVRLALFLANTTYPVLHRAISQHGAHYDSATSYREFVINVLNDERETTHNPLNDGLAMLSKLGIR
jgi:hypothetical protein